MEVQTFLALFVVISLGYAPLTWRTIVNNWKLRSIPIAGASGYLTSYIGALRFLRNPQETVQEGYDKYRGSIFKVPTLKSWMIFTSNRHHIDDIRRASDDVLSAREASKELLSTDMTVGPNLFNDPFLIEATRGPLTKNIGARFSDVVDEIVQAFNDHIPMKENEWITITAYETIMEIVCRATNRMFLDLPLCRNSDWIDLIKNFAIDVLKASYIIRAFPPGLRRYIAPLLRSVPRDIERAAKHLEPLIRERLRQEEEHGEDWPERPNDIFTWFFEVTEGGQRKIRDFSIAVLMTNFAAVHTTTLTFTNVLFDLATRPEYVKPLREEVEAVIKEEGWSKDSIGKLRKVDSFIKEVLRLSVIGVAAMRRKVLKDFTFSDGTTIPAGSNMAVPIHSVHTDPDTYTNPEVFDGFRFEKLRQREGEELKHQLVTLELDYVLFGHGRHACPGRFFVINELKAMLACILLNYDVKMADGQGRPESWHFGEHALPDPTAKVMFRKRSEVDCKV